MAALLESWWKRGFGLGLDEVFKFSLKVFMLGRFRIFGSKWFQSVIVWGKKDFW
jgi:hypothetical protein